MAGEYGRIVSAPMVEDSVERAIRAWCGAYLGETLVQAGLGRFDLPDPTGLVLTSDPGEWKGEDHTTLIIVASPGMSADAEMDAESMHLPFSILAGALVSRPERRSTRRAAQFYAAALFMCLQQKGIDLDGAHVTALRENYNVQDSRDDRTLMIGQATFTVMIADARARYGGPDDPPAPEDPRPPGEGYGTVESASVGFHLEPIDGELPDSYPAEEAP